MKHVFFTLLLGLLAIGLMGTAGCKKKTETEAEFTVKLGEPVVFAMKYQDSEDGQRTTYMRYARPVEEWDSPFIDAVKEKAENELIIVQNYALTKSGFAAIEHKDEKALNLYIDLDQDGKLGDNEKISPSSNEEGVPTAAGIQRTTTKFAIPELTIKNSDGQTVLYKMIASCQSYKGRKTIYWIDLGYYEGTCKLHDKTMRLYVSPLTLLLKDDENNPYARRTCALVPENNDNTNRLRWNTFGEMLIHDKTLYHVNVGKLAANGQSLEISLAEDISPRGQIEFTLQGETDLRTQNRLCIHCKRKSS